ncbi:glycosyltransferase family 2 protein [Flavobacterium sp. HXWNR29]|uniref:glycosyltransferase family 2 protein n=1 Tax=Flavobacterium odoriferum TaxID=2946604 RepID=UPI0021CB4F9F|nr:glycosyltransferase family 2 protein [Flavobacterium sp. HXWNR29]MCU4188558.1 glycosyltransferase family 2 protein [Flavobacterium sp. HXWNR29]
MQLSVIILNYNVRYFLEQCVLCVQKALEDIDGEIIVIDNASSDDSCEMMKTKFPHIKLIENKDNLGFPKGNNIGVAQAKGEYICILNPDTVVAEDTFFKILNSQLPTRNSQLGIIGCKLIDGAGNFLPESKRGVPTPWVAFTKIFGLYKISSYFGKYYAQHLSENESGKVDILVGAFMVMKRELYIEVGGFDENCFMYSDDIDLSYLVLKTGKSNYYFHETSVIHYKGESTVRDGTYMKRFREAMQFFYKKHFKKSWFFDVMMQVGSFVFSLLKKNQQKNEVRTIDEYIVFSKGNLELNLSKKATYLADFNQFVNQPQKNIEIIFDTTTFSFAEIITFMQLNKSNNLSFKNYISSSNYLIGSNNSNDRGQIILL